MPAVRTINICNHFFPNQKRSHHIGGASESKALRYKTHRTCSLLKLQKQTIISHKSLGWPTTTQYLTTKLNYHQIKLYKLNTELQQSQRHQHTTLVCTDEKSDGVCSLLGSQMPPLEFAATMMLLPESEKVESSGLFKELIHFRNKKTYRKQ